MTYKIRLTKTSEQHLTQWRKTGRTKMLLKIVSLFEELRQHPRFGTGQVEQLKGNLSGYWSRRIDKHHRMIYMIEDDTITVEVVSLRGHYDDK